MSILVNESRDVTIPDSLIRRKKTPQRHKYEQHSVPTLANHEIHIPENMR